eukprot:1526709-Lingulodinium_polyedra.AAC.1
MHRKSTGAWLPFLYTMVAAGKASAQDTKEAVPQVDACPSAGSELPLGAGLAGLVAKGFSQARKAKCLAPAYR